MYTAICSDFTHTSFLSVLLKEVMLKHTILTCINFHLVLTILLKQLVYIQKRKIFYYVNAYIE